MQTFGNRSTLSKSARTAVAGLALLLLPALSSAAIKPMPALNAKTLNGDVVNLPLGTSGKPLVLVFGFGRSSKAEGETWGKELVAMDMKDNDFNFFQVAMLDGAPRFTHSLITRAIRAAVPAAYYSHMLLLTENAKPWKEALDVTNTESTYVALCSPTGEIEWQTRGAGQAQFDALRAELQKSKVKGLVAQRGADVNF